LGKKIPEHYTEWVNIKHTVHKNYNFQPTGMSGMLTELGIELTGRHHSGIDDCRNIAKVVIRCVRDGALICTSKPKTSPFGKCRKLNWIEFGNNLNSKITFCGQVKQNSILAWKGHYNVTHIVSLFSDDYEENFIKECQELGQLFLLQLIEIPLFRNDPYTTDPNLIENYKQKIDHVVQILRESESSIVLSCHNGIERSGIICYIILRKLGFNDDESKDFIKKVDNNTFNKALGKEPLAWALKILDS